MRRSRARLSQESSTLGTFGVYDMAVPSIQLSKKLAGSVNEFANNLPFDLLLTEMCPEKFLKVCPRVREVR